MVPTTRNVIPTAKKWFLPSKNGSYRPPNDSYRLKTVPTVVSLVDLFHHRNILPGFAFIRRDEDLARSRGGEELIAGGFETGDLTVGW